MVSVEGEALSTIKQRPSHASLLHDACGEAPPPATSRRARLDAIVVPASRPASALRGALSLSVRLSTPLLVLCSRQTRAEQVADRIAETPGARAQVVEVPRSYEHDLVKHETADFGWVSAGRSSDLSLKRNLAILLGRMQGWRKILYLDDDITQVRSRDIARLAGLLDRHQVAGMICQEYPDNSVACHARRLAGLAQGNFVSGAVLGVNLADHPLSFFPDVYNEDWFFMARPLSMGRRVPKAGEARQAEYDPYADPRRAEREEFGDMVAEGLYNWFAGVCGLPAREQIVPSEEYWKRFLEARQESLDETLAALGSRVRPGEPADTPMHKATASLNRAQACLAQITPTICADFLRAWGRDLAVWERVCERSNKVSHPAEAFDRLGLSARLCEFGNPDRSAPRTSLAVSRSRGAR
jgi:hypothetical protein